MQSKGFMKRAIFGAAAVASVLLAGAAQAALQDRDLDGDKVVDAFYDTDLDITWLRDAMPIPGPHGSNDWATTMARADDFSFAGYDDWRLPTGGGGEINHLWYVELGNSYGKPLNHGNFESCCWAVLWTKTEFAPDPSAAWAFSFSYGADFQSPKTLEWGAMLVRPGDVAAVPEPEAYALMLAGLAALAMVARRRPS